MDTDDFELAVAAVILLRRVRKRRKTQKTARKTQTVVNKELQSATLLKMNSFAGIFQGF